MQLSNYLFFTTNCEAALAFYADLVKAGAPPA